MSKYDLGHSLLGKRKLQQPYRPEIGESQGLFVTPAPQDDVFAPDSTPGVRGDYSPPGPDQATDGSADHAEASAPEMDDDGHAHDFRYSDWQEQLPSHPAFSPNVERLDQEALIEVLRLRDVLQKQALDSKILLSMIESATSAVQQSAGPKMVVGLLGGTGTGKSSTINSLTSIPGLAVAVAAGESCTKVPMLFTHELPSQSDAFAAEIRYSNPDTCRKLLKEQLKSYFRYTYEYDEEWDDGQQKEYENACQTAFKIFRSLFCDKPDFESPRAGKEFLEIAYHRNDDTALDAMETWCRSLLSDMVTEEGAVLRFDAENVNDLNENLSPHITEHHDFEVPALCHLIDKVTIGARDSRILQYVTLADLPGQSDVDQVRAAIAQEFLQQCDAVLIFEPMARCVDHPSAERNIAINAERFGTNMALVVTRSDDNVDDALAQSMRKKGQSIGDYFLIGAQIKQLDSHIMQIKREIEKRRAVKRQKTTGSAFAGWTLEELRLQRSELIEEWQQQKNSQFGILVDTYTTRLLQHNKQRFMPPDVCLTVHCISNTHYISHLLDNEPDGTLLDVNATGIPALRAWLLEIIAPSLLLEIEERIGKCCAFVHGVAMWARSTPQKRKAGILDVARAPGLSWIRISKNTLRSVEAATDTSLLSRLQAKLGTIIEAALGYHQMLLSTWHPMTLRAFFLKDGSHSTKRQALPTCWNEKFTEFQTKEVLNPNWSKMKGSVHENLEVMVNDIIDELHRLPKELDKMEFVAAAAQMENVMGIITQYSGHIRRAHAYRLKAYDKQLSNLKQNATFDMPLAYFTEAMRPMYEEGSNMRGTGCVKRMMHHMANHLSGKGRRTDPFTAMHDSLRSDLSRANNRAVRKLQSDVAEMLRQLVKRFDAALAVEHEALPERIARKNIMPALAIALVEMEHIDRTLKELNRQSSV
ncbi:hypothetical protein D0869_05369 [Hortaea werneckii]|nr:hypothetical protein KC334_g11826 [Hortaea werneckii]KAI6998421.1 hypothetical protein KC355_g10154 [Hortaea werneckii]KAI7187780.1 hypothetical protein KC324_g6815 [Hortaea werneckii]KAI7588962.1 hypothetical protein KC316_g4192 [Hortaea werneckii]KAI7657821.1 hypothetical protein KC318_g11596 [Hortaea werneckii]